MARTSTATGKNGPPRWRERAHQNKRQRQRHREHLPNVSGGTRTARAARPAHAVFDVLLQRRASNVMLDHVGRKNHAVSGFGSELAEHEIFRQIVFHAREAADRLQHPAPGCESRANGEVHAFEHARDEHASPEIGVHPDRFETGPETRPGTARYGQVATPRCES